MIDKSHPAYVYAKRVTRREVNAPKYVLKQCREFIRVADRRDKKYNINTETVAKIDALLKLFIMPTGSRAGESIYSATIGYQWLFYVAVLCTVWKSEPDRRRYQTAILEICRKNFKTFTIAIIFLLLFFIEPRFSKFFSVAPDGTLSKEVQSAIKEIISASPVLRGDPERGIKAKFKVLRDYILCISTQNRLTPLACSNNRMDGRLPSVFLADEVGALRTSYPIQAMRSGQITLKNKLGCIISTKYPTFDNPFEDEVKVAKDVLDGKLDDETVFSLLYEPDKTRDWMCDDGILEQANPAALEIPEIMDDLKRKRQFAITLPSARENFVTKHCNIIYQGVGTESYIDIGVIRKCSRDKVDFTGLNVYVGVDLSMTNDNTAVAVVAYDSEREVLILHSMGFIPAARVDEKTAAENIPYYEFIQSGWCIACGELVIDYAAVEDYVTSIAERFGCKVMAIGYNRYNCLSSAQKWEADGYQTVEIRQHSSVLHSPTKRLKELFLSGKVEYQKNKLFEINVQNARCSYDTNMNMYLNKKRSSGKIDMVAAAINAVYLVEQNELLGDGEEWGGRW